MATMKASIPLEMVLVNQELTRGLKFECNQCGKCCNAGPAFTFQEAFELRDVFAMRLSVQHSVIPPNVTQEDNLAAHDVLQALGFAHSPATNSQPKSYLNVSPFAYSYQTGRCPVLLESGQCGIYDRRPSICKAVPFATAASAEAMVKSLRDFGARYGCISACNESTIDVDGINSNRAAMYDDNLSRYATFVLQALRVNPPAGQSSLPPDVIALVFDFNAKVNPSPANAAQGVEFAKSQIAILEKSIKDAITRKNRDDRATTKLHRDSVEKLKRYLQKGAW